MGVTKDANKWHRRRDEFCFTKTENQEKDQIVP